MIVFCRDVLALEGVLCSSGFQVTLRSPLRASTQAQVAINVKEDPLILTLCAGNVCRKSVSKQISNIQQVALVPVVSGICQGLALGCVLLCRSLS